MPKFKLFKIQCQICFEQKWPKHFQNLSKKCEHRTIYCKGCCEQFLGSRIEIVGVNAEIKCICGVILDYSEIKNCTNATMFDHYDMWLTRNYLNGVPNFRWCKNVHCKSGQIYSECDKRVMCCECSTEQCFSCNVTWHE
eukprot:Pgem_evm1s8718